jgi:hypothetical protein
MWRLIKAELGYLKYFIYAVSLLIVVHGVSNPIDYRIQNRQIFSTNTPIESLKDGTAYILPLHVIVIFVLLYFYVRESRLRQYVSMPVRKSQIILARLATPILLAVFFIFMSLIPMIVFGAYNPKDLFAYYHSVLRDYQAYNLVYSLYGWKGEWAIFLSSLYSNFELPLASAVYSVQMILFFTYAFWLFSERYGWYLLGVYFVFTVFHHGILPLVNAPLAWAISDFFQNSYSLTKHSMHIQINIYLLYASIVFAMLIAFSFYTRRSFLR